MGDRWEGGGARHRSKGGRVELGEVRWAPAGLLVREGEVGKVRWAPARMLVRECECCLQHDWE